MRWFVLCAVVLFPSVALAADTWTSPHPGIRRLHRTTTTQNINVLVVDLCAPGVSVRATKTGERQRVVSSFANLVGAKAAVNGDFFSFETYSTTGPSMGDGGAWGGGDGNFVAPAQFGPNRVALPNHTGTGGVATWARQVVSGHPSLIVNGAKKDYPTYELCTAQHPRTALGFTADGKKLILAVVDGRATGRVGMTCPQLATLMAELDADDAVNLDGGGSSTMWVAGRGVVNYPSDGAERVVANHLAIRATGTGAAPHCPLPTYAGELVTADAPLEMRSGDEVSVAFEVK
ncbi:MAG TPA: phosphodiester glycosidase family protein, partial [Kofleriaceae bacterium]